MRLIHVTTFLRGKLLTKVIAILMLFWFSDLKAQKKGYFSVNDKNIHIESFNDEIEKMMKEVGVPGISLAVIEDNKIVFFKNYGYKQLIEKNRVNKKTIFEGCSLSKSFLVYVAFKLVDEGKLDLDKPMYQYLDPSPFLGHDLRYKLITPRMILSHSSGIENWKKYNNPNLLEIVSNPGEEYVYSGTGYNYLSAVIESILKEPYDEYVKRMIIKPLKLKRTFVKFKEKSVNPFHKGSPWNYAIGHDAFGKELKKRKNLNPDPASLNIFTAKDYAKLVLGTFDKSNLSQQSIETLLTPVVHTSGDDFPNYYGTGFEIFLTGNDTIIAQGGDNAGFSGQLLYSIVNKRGIVFFSNSDRGNLLTTRLCEISVGLNVKRFLENSMPHQYPSNGTRLMAIYRNEGSAAMFEKLEKLKQTKEIDEISLYALGWDFMDHDRTISRQLLEENIILFPTSSTSYGFLGELYLKMNEFNLAHDNFVKAKELNFKWWKIENKLKECKEKEIESEKKGLDE